MSNSPVAAERMETAKSTVRLRTPERRQMAWVPQCTDDLVGPNHTVRIIAALVEKLDVSRFCEPIKAREGEAGRDATDPRLLIALWLYATVRGIGSARELARRCQESASFQWLCGGVTVNHRLLSDFRTDHGAALDALLTQVIASLVDQGLVQVSRVSQDGTRVRVSAGAASFRREARLQELLQRAKEHVAELRRQVDGPEAAGWSARQKAARKRAAEERERRLEQAVAQLPELQQRQERAEQRAGQGQHGQKVRAREPRVSTTDPDARRMKMPNGGFNPAVNVQVATDTASRAIVGVAVTNEGSDSVGLSAPMRAQVEQRTGQKVKQQLLDGGYTRGDDIEQAHAQGVELGVELFVPPKPAKKAENQGHELEVKPGDSEAVRAWKRRMASELGKEIYKERAATSETVNADLRCYRGLTQMTVRGLHKIHCVALWCALAYNVMHFGAALLKSAS
jgi:transposase